MNKIFFFNSNTLWETDRLVWIIDKKYPLSPIFKISISDFNILKSGTYKSVENKAQFMNDTYYLPDSLVTKLTEKDININDIGFSFREFMDTDYSNEVDYKINYSIFDDIKNKTNDIYIISDIPLKYNKKIINDLESELEKDAIHIKKYYTLSEIFHNNDTDNNIYNISKIILSHLIGLEIDIIDNLPQFISNVLNGSDIVSYYDNNEYTIQNLCDIQKTFDIIYHNSTEEIKDIINKKFNNRTKKIIELYTFYNNKLNNKKLDSLSITKPDPIILFESFKLNINNKYGSKTDII